jgi:hypothetical protein
MDYHFYHVIKPELISELAYKENTQAAMSKTHQKMSE